MERITEMLLRIMMLSAFAAGLSWVQASASVPSEDAGRPHGAAYAAKGLMLAQSGDVEIYYDQFGRRVIVDAYSGQVIAIERPRRGEMRQQRREIRREQPQERYYLDDPEDMARLERDRRARQRGVAPAEQYRDYPPPVQDYEYRPREAYPREEYRREAYPRETYPRETFPEAPRGTYREQPEVVTRAPVERAPLGQPGPAVSEAVPAVPNIAEGANPPAATFGAREEVAALQILLDRRGASPGVIDGHFGSNVDKAIIAYRSITGENLKSTDAAGIKQALAASGGDPFVNYTITAEDAAGPFVASVPADYGEKAKLERLSYTSTAEMLAERFHMDEKYLRALNPEANFGRPGTIIRVANIGKPATTQVARIVADKANKQVRAYDASGKLVVIYPATIGSADTPSPSGVHKVTRVAVNPDYTYNPNINFKQGENTKILKIPPGPNGPVGSIWIALDKPTYGIHGTPDPSKIGKTESHGCVRLTNWDAEELAKLVKADVPVEFLD